MPISEILSNVFDYFNITYRDHGVLSSPAGATNKAGFDCRLVAITCTMALHKAYALTEINVSVF